MNAVLNVAVEAEDAGLRLDRWFRRHFPDIPHGKLQKLMRTGQIRLDGKRVDAGDRVSIGQVVRVPPLVAAKSEPSETKRQPDIATAEMLRALILHRDEDVIALNKPAGLAVQGGSGTTRHIDGMLDALRFDARERPRLVHRLDRDTSGLLLIARSASAAASLGEAFRGRSAEKIYWAIVVGTPKVAVGRVDAALAKRADAARSGGEAMVVDEVEGDRAITDYRVLDRAGRRAAWLELRPTTGRTHQLRVHCNVLGCPILGDRKYGGDRARIDGLDLDAKLHLHARAIRLPHPRGAILAVTADPPPHFKQTADRLGFDLRHAGQ